MQHNVEGRRKKERQVVDNIRSRSYHDLHLHQPAAIAPLLSRLRNLNNLALTSIGTFFSGPTITKTAAYLDEDGEEFFGHDLIVSCRSGLNANANRDSGCFWLKDPPSRLSNDESTPAINGFYTLETVDHSSLKPDLSARRLGTHDDLEPSIFPSVAGALIKNGLPLVQRASSFHAHIVPCRPEEVRNLLGDSHRSHTLDESDIQATYITTERSNFQNPDQNLIQLKSTSIPERATNSTLCATAAVFVPSSPAARALLSCDKSSLASFQTTVMALDITADNTETPPLTPDSSKTGLLSPALFSTTFEHVDPSYAACILPSSDRTSGEFQVDDDDNNKILYTSPQLLEIKEGKKREQPFAQHTNDHPSLRPVCLIPAPAPVSDDPEEWYGLEYTLELSSRERQPSDTQSFSAGEHSKSRESWAAIHQGIIHPSFGDEDYYQWKNWHRLLEKQDERRKHKKGFAFKAQSKDLSYLFVDEMRTRDLLYWQKRVYGVVARDVKERLNYVTAHCPDPYFPPKKHGLGWYLKRSRSLGCIRELKAIEDDRKPRKG